LEVRFLRPGIFEKRIGREFLFDFEGNKNSQNIEAVNYFEVELQKVLCMAKYRPNVCVAWQNSDESLIAWQNGYLPNI
jgi:hypothetical protein